MKLFCFMVLMTAVLYSVKGYPPPEQAKHYCGRRLVNALTILCAKSNNYEYDMAGSNDVDIDGYQQDYEGTRLTRSIGFECCERRCLLEELLAYCP